MGKGKRTRGFKKIAKTPKAIKATVSFQEEEILAIKTETDLDKLFEEKSSTALHNLKVDLKKFFGFGKEQSINASEKLQTSKS